MLSPQPIHMVCMVPRALGALARPMVYHPPPLCAAFRIQIVPASRFTGGRKRGALAWAARPPLTLGGSTIPARFCTFETPGLPAILSFVFPRRRCLRRCCIREEGLHEAPTPQVTQVAQVAQSPSSESLRRQVRVPQTVFQTWFQTVPQRPSYPLYSFRILLRPAAP